MKLILRQRKSRHSQILHAVVEHLWCDHDRGRILCLVTCWGQTGLDESRFMVTVSGSTQDMADD